MISKIFPLFKIIVSKNFIWQNLGAAIRRSGVAVLMYHRVTSKNSEFAGHYVSDFEDQMRWIKKNCTPLHPKELEEATCKSHTSRRPPVLITFDDGYRDYYNIVYPILKTLKIPAIVFLNTSLIDDGGLLWTDLIDFTMLKTKKTKVDLSSVGAGYFKISTERDRTIIAETIKKKLKSVPDEIRKRSIKALSESLIDEEVYNYTKRQMLNWDEVRRTIDITTFGGHGHTHAILSKLTSLALETEIKICQERIVSEIGFSSEFFAYPNGQPEDFNQITKKILHKYGFSKIFTTIEGINYADTDWSEVRRLSPYGNGSDLAGVLYRASAKKFITRFR